MTTEIIKNTILHLVTERGLDKSACPSEIARQLFPDDWRNHMEEVRGVARQLQRDDLIQITQEDYEFSKTEELHGAIRLRLKKKDIQFP